MKKIILLVGLLISSFAAQAIPILWEVENSTDLNGHFTYDADSNLYSAVDLTETHFDDTYNSIDAGNALGFTAISENFFDATTLFFDDPLTNAGGVIDFHGFTLCYNDCDGDYVNDLWGELVSKDTPVPEPSIIALFAAGLIGLGLARRRKA